MYKDSLARLAEVNRKTLKAVINHLERLVVCIISRHAWLISFECNYGANSSATLIN